MKTHSETPPKRRSSGWKERLAMGALLAGGLGDAGSHRTAAAEQNHAATDAAAHVLVTAGEQGPHAPEVTLSVLLETEHLNHNQLKQVGRLMVQEVLASGQVGRYHHRNQALREDLAARFQSARRCPEEQALTELSDVMIGITRALEEAAHTAEQGRDTTGSIQLYELVHPVEGIRAAMRHDNPNLAREILQQDGDCMHALLFQALSGSDAGAYRTILVELFPHLTQAQKNSLRTLMDHELSSEQDGAQRMQTRMARAGESQEAIASEMAQRERNMTNLIALRQELFRP